MIKKEKYQILFENFIKEDNWVVMAERAYKEMNEIEFDIKPAQIPGNKEGGFAKFVKIDPETGRRSDQEETIGVEYPSSEPELRKIVQDIYREQGDEEGADAVGVLAMTPDETIEKGREEAAAEARYFDNINIGDKSTGKGFETKVIDKDPNTKSITWAVKYEGDDDFDNNNDIDFSDAEDLVKAFIKKDY